MKRRNRPWLWNSIIIVTLLCCGFAFGVHYKNWISLEEGNLSIVSGIYRQKIPLTDIDGINFVQRIPEMERKNGFSWLAREKGVFLDSITGTKVYVFVDDLRHQKIELLHRDSLRLYVNLADSLSTQALYENLISKVENTN